MSDIDDQVQQQEDQEWDAAAAAFGAEHGLKTNNTENPPAGDDKEEPPKVDPPTPPEGETAEEKAAREQKEADDKAAAEEAERRKNETPEEKAEREKKEAEDKAAADAKAAEEARDKTIRDARAADRKAAQQEHEIFTTIRTELFPEKDGKIRDADGDVIATKEDVMQRHNVRTGKNFTEEEAIEWLMAAQQHANREKEQADQVASKATEVRLAIQDQAAEVRSKYHEFLAKPENQELRDQTLADYWATLRFYEDTDVAIEAPRDMLAFYDRALKPYIDAAQATSEADRKAEEAEAARKKAEEDAKKAHQRSDREDLYGRGDNKGTLDKEDQEWANVINDRYGKGAK